MSAVLNTFGDGSTLDWNATFQDPGDLEGVHGEDQGGHAHHVTLAILTLTILLGVAVTIGQAVHKYNCDWLSSAATALLVGMGVGLVLDVAPLPIEFEGVFQFSTDFFFIALLPPIVFDAAFRLNTRKFFANVGAILLLAFAGTMISALVIAVFMFTVGKMGLSYQLSFYNSGMFGVIISAIDPITILAVFKKFNTNRDLKALIFGESILNDAVCIVLFRVIGKFSHKVATFGGVMFGVWTFCKIFLSSLCVGALFGVGAAYIFKTRYFRNEHTSLEASLVIIFAYCSFYFADGMGLSGIVSIMVCGIMMAKYVRPNLDSSTNDRVGSFFSVIASLSENFVFIYIGFALFTESTAWKQGLTWGFVGFCLVALGLGRAANVYPNLLMVNYFRPPEMEIPRNHMFMTWFSGQRGSMAFALAMLARPKLGDAGDVIVTATFFMVLVTVLVNGGGAVYMLEKLNLRDVIPGNDSLARMGKVEHVTVVDQDSNLHGPDLHTISPTIGVGNASVHGGSGSLNGASTPGGSTHGRSMGVREKIHEFQRAGGVVEQFKAFDRTLGRVLINTEQPSRSPSQSPLGHGHGSATQLRAAQSSPGGPPL